MPRLVQVTAEQSQIPEEDAIQARDPDSGNHDLEKVAPKAREPNCGNRDPEEIVMKSRNPNSVYYRCREHEGARVLAVVRLFVAALIARKTVGIGRHRSLSPPASEASIISLISDSSRSGHETPDGSILSLSLLAFAAPIASRSSDLSCSRLLNSEPLRSTFPPPRLRPGEGPPNTPRPRP